MLTQEALDAGRWGEADAAALGELGKVRMPNVLFPDLGRVEDIRGSASTSLRFAFVPVTEAGETLARAMKTGAAWIEVVPPKPHVDLRGRPIPGTRLSPRPGSD